MLFIFSTLELIRNMWQLKTAVFLHWCLLHAVPLNRTFVQFSYFIDGTTEIGTEISDSLLDNDLDRFRTISNFN